MYVYATRMRRTQRGVKTMRMRRPRAQIDGMQVVHSLKYDRPTLLISLPRNPEFLHWWGPLPSADGSSSRSHPAPVSQRAPHVCHESIKRHPLPSRGRRRIYACLLRSRHVQVPAAFHEAITPTTSNNLSLYYDPHSKVGISQSSKNACPVATSTHVRMECARAIIT